VGQKQDRECTSAESEMAHGQVALKGFFKICREWGCSREEMAHILGGISNRILAKYETAPHLKLPQEHMERISYILGIYKATREMYPTAERANRRIRLETSEHPFSGCSAMDFMVKGSMENLVEARRYFDA